MSLLLTLNIFHTLFYVPIVNSEYVIAGWERGSMSELFPRLLGHLSTFSSFFGGTSVSLPEVDLKFSEELGMLLESVFD